jgi:hypothetical protein
MSKGSMLPLVAQPLSALFMALALLSLGVSLWRIRKTGNQQHPKKA